MSIVQFKRALKTRPRSCNAHFFASSLLKSLYEIIPADLQLCIATVHTMDYNECLQLANLQLSKCHYISLIPTCTQSKKKFRLKSLPERTYLFVTVIRMEEPQYERIGTIGVFEKLCDRIGGGAIFLIGGSISLRSPMSIV